LFRVSSRRNVRSSTLPITSTNNNLLLNKNSNIFHSSSNISIPPPKPPRQPLMNKTLVEANEYKPKNNLSIYTNSLLIKLKPDINGRYGFNIKVNCFFSF